MRSRLSLIFSIGFAVVVVFFLWTLIHPQKIVRLAGSTAFLPFAEKLAEKYMEGNPGTDVEVQGGGSAVGIMVASQGIADIGMVDMVTLPVEAERLGQTIVARDGIAVIVHPLNPVVNLNSAEIAGIFSGTISNWRQLGGKDAIIHVISREEGSGTRKSFDQFVLGNAPLTRTAMFQDSNGTIREAVAGDPDAIGYISIGFLDSKVKALSLNGIIAVNENVKNGTYRLARPVYFLTGQHPSRQTQAFVGYVLSRESQSIIESDGLVPVK